jgi:CHAT domain-containing protein
VGTLRTGLNPEFPKPFDRNLAYRLYRQVLGPIEEIISQKTRLSFVVDGALTSLPPQVLITTDPDSKDLNSVDWLVRKYAITVLPSASSLKNLRTSKTAAVAAKRKKMVWIDDYCRNHPADNLYRASAALVDEFRQKPGR